MEFGWAIYSGFSKYGQFRGRERRREYIYWMIFVFLGFALAGLLNNLTLTLVLLLLMALPTAAIAARRLHDFNRSGWWALTILMPVVGYGVVIALAFWPGSPDPNQHGAGGSARRTAAA